MLKIKLKARNIAVFLWKNNAYNAVVLTDGEYWICMENFDGINLYVENSVDDIQHYINNADFNSFADMWMEFSRDISGNSPTVGRNFGAEFSRYELEFCGMIYE